MVLFTLYTFAISISRSINFCCDCWLSCTRFSNFSSFKTSFL